MLNLGLNAGKWGDEATTSCVRISGSTQRIVGTCQENIGGASLPMANSETMCVSK